MTVATADIPADTVLFTIPRNRIICTATAELASRIPSVFADSATADVDTSMDSDSDSASPHDSWTSLILLMIYEHFQGANSRWKPYLDILPTEFDTPMFWTDAELAGLQATSVASMIGRDEADKMLATKILPVIHAHPDVFFGPGSPRPSDAELMQLAHRMGSTIMAYAFDLARDSGSDSDSESGAGDGDGWVEDRDGKGVLGMVPMADMLNADADFNAHVNHEEGALVATTLRPIGEGEEVLNYYGPVSNGELLRRYGYVTCKYRRWDVVELPWKLVAARIRDGLGLSEEVWAKAVSDETQRPRPFCSVFFSGRGVLTSYVQEKKVDLEDIEDAFVIEWGSEEPDSSGHVDDTLRFHGLPDELAEQVKAFLKALRKVDPNGAGVKLSSSDARLGVFLTTVRSALTDRAAQFDTTLEEDLLRREQENPAGRAGKALAVRVGEKILLQEAQKWVRNKLQELGRTSGETDAPSAKRQRCKK